LPSFISFFSGLYEYHHQVTRHNLLAHDQPHLLANLAPDYVTVQFNDDVWLSPKYGFARNSDCFLTSSKANDVYADRWLFANAQRFLEANPLPAMFMFLHTYKLHTPYEPGEEFLTALNPHPRLRCMGSFIGKAQFNAKVPEIERHTMEELYDTEVLQFDHFFGEFIMYLKLAGIYDQSLIVLISDHGEEFGEHGGWFHGHSLYREVSRVPFLIKFPENRYAGRHYQEFVSICDALPTVLDYLQIKIPSGIDGISLLPLLQGSRTQRRTVFSSAAVSLFNEYLPPRLAMFFDHYQLIFNFPLTPKAQDFYQKFGQPPVRSKIELYDMQTDPIERSDISSQQQKLLDSLRPEIILVLKELRQPHNTGSASSAMSEEELKVLRSLGYL
jgi:arylsulfatase A-like enzyme